MSIVDALKRLEAVWGEPRSAEHGGEPTFFKLRCAVVWGAVTSAESNALPTHLGQFWAAASGARLFVDEEYGQWGLVLFDRAQAESATRRFRRDRHRDQRSGDLIVGEFKGDSDLLLVRCDPAAADFGSVLVVTPLDGRDDWAVAASSLLGLVEALEIEQGEKFWE